MNCLKEELMRQATKRIGAGLEEKSGVRNGFVARGPCAFVVGIALLVHFSGNFAQAEDVPMKNGAVLKGEVLDVEEDPVTIKTEQGIILAPKKDIDKEWLAARQTPKTEPSPTPAAAETLPTEARIQLLEAKIATLEATIEALRAELKLAKLSESPPAKTPAIPKAAQSLALTAPIPPPAAHSSVPAEGGYWLSTASGVRHNRTCRYYMKTKGRPCLQTEGTACTKCGG